MNTETKPKLFTISPCGDPYNRNGWDVCEYEKAYTDRYAVFRGDISPIQGRRNTVETLRRLYPGCRIRIANH